MIKKIIGFFKATEKDTTVGELLGLKDKEYIVTGKDISKRDFILITWLPGLKNVHVLQNKGLWDILKLYSDEGEINFTVNKENKILKIIVKVENNPEIN